MNHTAGFKKFSDLIVESQDGGDFSGISTAQNEGDFSGLADFISVMDVECVNDFDLATERTLTIGSDLISDEIVFNSAILQDYFESVGNRVLIIDDFSDRFNSTPRNTRFVAVGTFDLDTANARKFITFVRDRRFTAERQIYLVTLLHDETYGYINQYGRVETVAELGSFDFSMSGDQGVLEFYPIEYRVNNFDVTYVSYNLKDTISGVGSTVLGDVVELKVSNALISAGSTAANTIVGIETSNTASKVLVEIAGTDGSYYEFNEVMILHDGTDVGFIDYGQIVSSSGATSSSGIGTYHVEYSGSNINLVLTPTVGAGVSYVVNTMQVSIANTASTGIGTEDLNTGILESSYTSIAASGSPSQTTIAEYDNSAYNVAYYIVSVEDTTNSNTQVSEVVVADDGSYASITEFGQLYSDASLGTIDAGLSGSTTQLYFTPNAGIDVQVRVFQNAVGDINEESTNDFIDLTSGSVDTSFAIYRGTESDVRREFVLTHDDLPIFERYFDGSDVSIANTTTDRITIPNHFFVTGEEISYTHSGAGTTQAIGIAPTNIVGFGLTDKLPSTLYAVKVDDLHIKLAGSAENALAALPSTLNLTHVGIGTSHRFVARKQNSRALVSIDNVIQSPVVSTAVTSSLALEAKVIDDLVTLTGITSIFGGDLLKVNDEIMRVNSVGIGTTNRVLVERAWMGTGLSTHSPSALVTKVQGDYNIVDNKINFVTAPYGPSPLSTTSNPPDSRDWTGITTHSTFSGRTFMRSGVVGATTHPYDKNYIFDSIADGFNGITTQFTLKSDGVDVSGISTSNAIILVNEIFQKPQPATAPFDGTYDIIENAGISSVQFTGAATSAFYDINTSTLPIGGVIVSVGSSEGLGYQPLVAAGGTATISGLGTISAISIGNSGSGYRAGIQTVVNVGIATSSTGTPNIEFIGTAAISGGHIVSVAITNPGAGYTATNPPVVVFDDPLSYSNIPLTYSSTSSGIGSNATIDIVVGQGSSVIDFEIRNTGYGYGQGETLTVAIGGTAGIPTDTSYPFEEFQIRVDRTQSDTFSGWTVGDLQVFDTIDDLFDGVTLTFPLSVNGNQTTIRARVGSIIDIKATLLVFINDILQVPDQGYIFNGGSYLTFTEAPKEGDTCKILFYRGTGDVDVVDVDVLETIKVGDNVRLNDDDLAYKEDERLVTDVVSTDTIHTNAYAGPGITQNETYSRPLIWCRQRDDLFIDGKEVTKDRVIYEPLIQPTTNIIEHFGVGSTVMYVESVRTFFDNEQENSTKQDKVTVISQDSKIAAAATAIVSGLGTISAINITNIGYGYSTAPSVTIANPVGLGTDQRASAVANITNGIVDLITVTSPGTGYTSSNPPVVIVEEPKPTTEDIDDVSYVGDFGVVVGYGVTTIGTDDNAIFDFYIPEDSYLRDTSVVGTAVTLSGIGTGDFFVINNSNVGRANTTSFSYRLDGSIIGISTQYVDSTYQVNDTEVIEKEIVGIGTTTVVRVFTVVEPSAGVSTVSMGASDIFFDSTYYTWDIAGVTTYSGAMTTSNYLGDFTWGKIFNLTRPDPQQFTSYGYTGINTSPVVVRTNPLRYINYNT